MHPFRVLVVTDVPWVAEDVSLDLAHDKYLLDVVESGAKAVQKVFERMADLVVVDMQVGSMGGPAVVSEVRNHLDDAIASTPILCLMDRQADSWICKKLGADEVLLKPIEPGSLERVVRRLLRNKAGIRLGA